MTEKESKKAKLAADALAEKDHLHGTHWMNSEVSEYSFQKTGGLVISLPR